MILKNYIKFIKKPITTNNNIIIINFYSSSSSQTPPIPSSASEFNTKLKAKPRQNLPWTEEEIEVLTQKVSEYSNNWKLIHQKFFNHRSLGSIQSKYYNLKKLQLLKIIQQNRASNQEGGGKGQLSDNIEFNQTELNLLKDLKQKNLSIYEVYMRYFSYRNPEIVFKQFKKLNYNSPLIQGTWSPQEIDKLFKAIKLFGRNWIKVSNYIGTRNQIQCMMYWDYHISRLNSNNWSVKDDKNLMELVKEFGLKNWVKIGRKFKPNKGGRHCKARYKQLISNEQEKESNSKDVNSNGSGNNGGENNDNSIDNEVKVSSASGNKS